MTPSNPWLRFFAGLVAAAVAIRVIVELLEPVLPFLIGAMVLIGVLQIHRWWHNRW
jgi:hypothetical protein